MVHLIVVNGVITVGLEVKQLSRTETVEVLLSNTAIVWTLLTHTQVCEGSQSSFEKNLERLDLAASSFLLQKLRSLLDE